VQVVSCHLTITWSRRDRWAGKAPRALGESPRPPHLLDGGGWPLKLTGRPPEVTELEGLETLFVRLRRKSRAPMNMLLWVLQVLAALLYGSSGVMKVFMFDKVSRDVRSFGALPREAWITLGILELLCTVGLIVPAAFHWHPPLTILAATVLAVESLVFVGVHVKYREVTPMILSGVLGLLMAFIAYGRMVLKPIL